MDKLEEGSTLPIKRRVPGWFKLSASLIVVVVIVAIGAIALIVFLLWLFIWVMSKIAPAL